MPALALLLGATGTDGRINQAELSTRLYRPIDPRSLVVDEVNQRLEAGTKENARWGTTGRVVSRKGGLGRCGMDGEGTAGPKQYPHPALAH